MDNYLNNLGVFDLVGKRMYVKLHIYMLENPDKVYTVLKRIKDVESVRDKIIRTGNKELRDVVGLRVVCYFKENIVPIHEHIKELEERDEIVIIEKELHYLTGHTLCEEEKHLINKEGFRESPKQSGYSAVHYTMRLADDEKMIPFEVQVRTMFQETFGQLGHDITYKHFPTTKTESFKSLGGMIRELDQQVQEIKVEIDEKKAEIRDKIQKIFSVSDDSCDEILEAMRRHQIDAESLFVVANEVAEGLYAPFTELVLMDKEMIVELLCLSDWREDNRLDVIVRYGKCRAIKRFLTKLKRLDRDSEELEKYRKIIEQLSEIDDSEIIAFILAECAMNVEPLKQLFLKELNNFVKEIFIKQFLEEDAGLGENESVWQILVEVWDWLEENEREEWKKHLVEYIEKAESANADQIITSILRILRKESLRRGIDDSLSDLLQILEEKADARNS